MEQLLFKNPELSESAVNVSVRRGSKWYKKFHTDKVRDVEIAETDGPVVGMGKLIGATYVMFHEIPQSWLDMEHASNCRNLEDLYFNGMLPAYPDFEFTEYVTVLFFTAKPNEK